MDVGQGLCGNWFVPALVGMMCVSYDAAAGTQLIATHLFTLEKGNFFTWL